ncbi:hypothetical protein E2C01_034966 [Portunus trituberculatus]|uniref:Uncharacterized protein n=1 Tax=Portunus trituberculatus TaxID=210409 RepID=A0A5B7F7T4_PORTR|nr:hypothetical protein [Portunus trituberculatus]
MFLLVDALHAPEPREEAWLGSGRDGGASRVARCSPTPSSPTTPTPFPKLEGGVRSYQEPDRSGRRGFIGLQEEERAGGTCLLLPGTWYPLQCGRYRLRLLDGGIVGISLLQEVGLVLLSLLVILTASVAAWPSRGPWSKRVRVREAKESKPTSSEAEHSSSHSESQGQGRGGSGGKEAWVGMKGIWGPPVPPDSPLPPVLAVTVAVVVPAALCAVSRSPKVAPLLTLPTSYTSCGARLLATATRKVTLLQTGNITFIKQ